MKIDSRAVSAYQSSINLRVSTAQNSQTSQGKGASSAASKEDARVTISAQARQLAAGGASATPDSDADSGIDQAKVAALKDKIQNGTLNLDSNTIAARIVDRTG